MAFEQFHFTASDGSTIDIPFMKHVLSLRWIKQARKDYAEEEFVEQAILKAGGQEIYDKVMDMPLVDSERFIEQWVEGKLGESSAS